MQDIAPELLERIRREFLSLLGETGQAPADYAGAMQYAERVGDALAEALRRHLSADLLPDGRMYWNIADRVLRPLLEEDHALVSAAAQAAQQALNTAAGIGIKAQAAPLDTSRVEGILNAVSSAEQYEDAAWLLAEPVRTFSRAVVDETLRRNVEFQGRAGLRPKVVRKAESHCCEWCSRLAGSYEYPDVPKDVYRRHSRCRCRVEYDPGSGKRQNVHTKQWTTDEETAKIEVRKFIGLKANGVQIQGASDHVVQRMQERSVSPESIVDALENPLEIGEIKWDDKGRPSFRVTGEKATLYINPETGVVVTTHSTHSKLAKKLKKKTGEAK